LGLIHIDFQLKLDLIDSSGTTNLTIEAQFHLKKANLDMVLTPGETASLAPILPLYNAKVIGVIIDKTGKIIVEFENGYLLEVTPDEKYEAWQIGCPIGSGVLLVCAPGGEVALFRK